MCFKRSNKKITNIYSLMLLSWAGRLQVTGRMGLYHLSTWWPKKSVQISKKKTMAAWLHWYGRFVSLFLPWSILSPEYLSVFLVCCHHMLSHTCLESGKQKQTIPANNSDTVSPSSCFLILPFCFVFCCCCWWCCFIS